jgi:hypothetical protein
MKKLGDLLNTYFIELEKRRLRFEILKILNIQKTKQELRLRRTKIG